jgi:hypothetical protein
MCIFSRQDVRIQLSEDRTALAQGGSHGEVRKYLGDANKVVNLIQAFKAVVMKERYTAKLIDTVMTSDLTNTNLKKEQALIRTFLAAAGDAMHYFHSKQQSAPKQQPAASDIKPPPMSSFNYGGDNNPP